MVGKDGSQEAAGTTQNEERDTGKRGTENRSSSLGSFGLPGEETGDEQIGFDRENSHEWNRGGNVGGILRQLKLSKRAHLEYVEAHINRLQSRLAEATKIKESLIEELKDLDQS